MANVISTKNITIGVQGGQGTTLYARWSWSKKYTKEYQFQWQYHTGKENIWYDGSSGSTTLKNTTYGYPANAKKVRFRVKPISSTYTKNKKIVNRWTAKYSSWKTYTIKPDVNKTPADPTSTPELVLNGLSLTVRIDNITDPNSKCVNIEILQDHRRVFWNGYFKVINGFVSANYSLISGHEYSVRYRGVNLPKNKIPLSASLQGSEELFGKFSEYVNIETPPEAIPVKLSVKSTTTTSVVLSWTKASGATSYEIEYTNKPSNFDTSTGVNTLTVEGKTEAIIEGLTDSNYWYFRARSINQYGSSSWSSIVSTVIGTTPTAPTTWQTTTRAVIGEDVIIHWVHNNEDGSDVQGVTISYNQNEGPKQDLVWTISQGNNTDFQEGRFTFDTSGMKDNTTINWCVRTKGLLPSPKDWGPFSVTRSFIVFEEPKVFLNIYREKKWYWNPFNFTIDSIYTAKGDLVGLYTDPIIIEKYPFYLIISTQPDSQYPLDFNVSIAALEEYQTIDDVGEIRNVNEGEVIYSKSGTFGYHSHIKEIIFMPFDADLENDVPYKLTCSVAFDSGLSADGTISFRTAFESIGDYDVNAETAYDEEKLSMYIQPYCRYESDDEEVEGALVSDVRLSVYRRTFDGQFIEIAKDLQNVNMTSVIDPHPELKYARYRIVIMSSKTGMVDFYDLPSYPIMYPSIVIQWQESWRNFNSNEAEEDAFADPLQSGTMLKLPYNIDITDQTTPDVEKVEYIGREFPVSYYGTQIGQATSYSTDIASEDNNRILAIRKLMRWMGDVYLRDPSGIGYWANVTVSYSHTHNEVHIPISINATRVEGGK